MTWLAPNRAKLRVRIDGATRSKTVRIKHRDHGGRGEAEAALRAFEAELETVENQGTTWTVTTLLDDYRASRARIGKAQTTLESYEHVAKRLTPELSARKLDELTPDDLDLFYGELANRGLSAATVRHTHSVLSAAMGYAVQKDRMTSNIAQRATPPDAKAKPKERITPDMAWRMIAAAGDDVVLAMAIFLATYAGGRRGELCGLQWSDFDPAASVLHYQRQWVPVKGGQVLADLKSDTGTVDGKRSIHLGPQTVAVLERFRVRQRETLHREPEGWLLSYDGGHTPLRAKSLSEAIPKLGKSVGLTVTLHSFRRTSDTELHAAGVDLDTASRRQGHTTEVMMRHYVQGADDKAVAAATALEARLIDQGLPIGELLT